MEPHPTLPWAEPPDLLKRFVPTPFRADLRLEEADVVVQTNDAGILNVLREYENRSGSHHCQRFVWTLVRDDVRLPLLQPTVVHLESVTFASMGPACFIGLDEAERKLFAFFGSTVDDFALRLRVFPLLHELTRNAFARQEEKPPREFGIVSSSTNDA